MTGPGEDMLGKTKYICSTFLLITEICITLSISLYKVRSTVTLPEPNHTCIKASLLLNHLFFPAKQNKFFF